MVFLLCGCAKKFEQMSPKEIYEFGSEKYTDKKFTSAIEAYEKLIDLYPFSVFVAKAELGIADSYFRKRRWEEAIPAYEDFILRHPTNDQVPHAVYNLGMCYYSERFAIDRDQTTTFKAEENFRRVVTSYPDSEYYDKAKSKLSDVRGNLAKRERYVAKFYFRDKEYYASLRRYLRVIQNYPDTKYFEEALFYSAMCYLELDEKESAMQQFKILQLKYSDGKYAKKADKVIEKLGK